MSITEVLQRAAAKASERRFTAEPVTGFGAFPLPTDCAARMAEIWPSDEQALAADEEADRLAQEQEDRDEWLRERAEANGDGPGQVCGGPR